MLSSLGTKRRGKNSAIRDASLCYLLGRTLPISGQAECAKLVRLRMVGGSIALAVGKNALWDPAHP